MYSSDNSSYQSKSATVPGPFSTQTSTSSFDQSAPSSFSNQKVGTPLPYQLKPKVPWSTGLCQCFSDVRLCCLTLWCPCITFGRIAEVVDKGGSSCCASGALYVLLSCVTGCPCLYSCFYRSKMRRQYPLQENLAAIASSIAAASAAPCAKSIVSSKPRFKHDYWMAWKCGETATGVADGAGG